MGGSPGFAALERVAVEACRREREWAAGVAAGVYAVVDYAIANPEIAENDPTALESAEEFSHRYDSLIDRFTGLLTADAPARERRFTSSDSALVAGVAGIIGDHLRLRRVERLAALRPELVLIVLLPYVGFEEAQRWADHFDSSD